MHVLFHPHALPPSLSYVVPPGKQAWNAHPSTRPRPRDTGRPLCRACVRGARSRAPQRSGLLSAVCCLRLRLVGVVRCRAVGDSLCRVVVSSCRCAVVSSCRRAVFEVGRVRGALGRVWLVVGLLMLISVLDARLVYLSVSVYILSVFYMYTCVCLCVCMVGCIYIGR